MRYTYWHRHPRQFANECCLLKACTRGQIEDLITQGFERLSLRQTRRHLAHVNAENTAWGSNRAIGLMRFDEIATYTEYQASYT